MTDPCEIRIGSEMGAIKHLSRTADQQDCCSSNNWMTYVLEKWEAGDLEARVFTDKWPQCSCVVVVYKEWVLRDADDVEFIIVTGQVSSIIRTLQHPGVIDWSKASLFPDAIKQSTAKRIVESVCHPQGAECGSLSYVASTKCYALKNHIVAYRAPEGFTFQELQPSHAEYIALYWPYWDDRPLLRTARFLHCIDAGSVGLFTQTTPPQLVSWAVVDVYTSSIHHLYTLEEYRRRGLASAVVRELCRKIQAKGEVPLSYVALGNHTSVALFEKLDFSEQKESFCFLHTEVTKP